MPFPEGLENTPFTLFMSPPRPPSVGSSLLLCQQISITFDPSSLQIADVLNGWSLRV